MIRTRAFTALEMWLMSRGLVLGIGVGCASRLVWDVSDRRVYVLQGTECGRDAAEAHTPGKKIPLKKKTAKL